MPEILPAHNFVADNASRVGSIKIEMDCVFNNPGLMAAVFESIKFVTMLAEPCPASGFVKFTGLSPKFSWVSRGACTPEYGLTVDARAGTAEVGLIRHGVDVSSASDIELLQELIKRNGKAPAAKTTSRHGEWFSITVGIGKDETAEITLTDDALKALGEVNA